MDEYLLGADLKRYLEPWAYARLNVVERALLAQRIPGEAAATARHLRELWELLPPNPEREDQLFETALARSRAERDGAGRGVRCGAKEVGSRGARSRRRTLTAVPRKKIANVPILLDRSSLS